MQATIKPDLVMMSACLNGQTGPYKDYPGFGSQGAALAGFNAGQGIPDDPNSDQSFNFVDNGFTHLDLSAAVPFTAGPVSISPVVHFVVTGDEATKFTKFDPNTGTVNSKDVKVWFGGTISWSKALGAAAEEGGETSE